MATSLPVETQVYTPDEIAAAAGLDAAVVRAAAGQQYVGHAEAVEIALRLRRADRLEKILNPSEPAEPFALITAPTVEARRAPLALSGAAHVLFVSAAILLGSFQVAPAAGIVSQAQPTGEARLVFLNLPGPGGGGGGGGNRMSTPPAQARRRGSSRISSPIPDVAPPVPPQAPPEPPPLSSETFPIVNAPVVAAPADRDEQRGVLETAANRSDSQGPGTLDGSGTGNGHGVGAGQGSGIGEGSGGGTGGGPFRPGAGITPPRMLREVKATYTEEARRAGITGEVLLEVVVRSSGQVGSVRLLRGLGAGLDQRAIDAVRQWLFAPASRDGTPVDVIVEISVEFSLR